MEVAERARRDARAWFGQHVCVVEGDVGKAVDLHHLDPKSRETKYNLVPLSSSVHQGHHRDPDYQLPYEELASIDLKAWRHYDSGRCKLAYGAQRFLAFATRRRHPSQSLRHVAAALTSLRPLFSVDFAADTLARSAKPAIPKASPISKAILAMEISLWFRDCNDIKVGERWIELSSTLFAKAQEVDPLTEARFQMILAVSSVLRHERAALRKVRAAKEGLGYRTVKGNAKLWEAVCHLWDHNPSTFVDLAYEVMSETLPNVDTVVALPVGFRLPHMHFWTMAQNLLILADAAERKGKADERYHYAHLAYQLFQTTEIIPAGNLSRASLEWYMDKCGYQGTYRIPTRTRYELKPLYLLLPSLETALSA